MYTGGDFVVACEFAYWMRLLIMFSHVTNDVVVVCAFASNYSRGLNHIHISHHHTTHITSRTWAAIRTGKHCILLFSDCHSHTRSVSSDVRMPVNWRCYNIMQYSRVNVYTGSACLPVSFRFSELHAVAPAKRALFGFHFGFGYIYVLILFTNYDVYLFLDRQ